MVICHTGCLFQLLISPPELLLRDNRESDGVTITLSPANIKRKRGVVRILNDQSCPVQVLVMSVKIS